MRSETLPVGQRDRTFVEEARRAQIVACAIETIADLGYAQASLAQIASRAGVSKGVISYHFAGKDDLIRQVVGDVFAAGAEFMIPRVLAAAGPAAMLRTYITSNLEFMTANRKSLVALVDILVHRQPESGQQPTADAVQPLKDMLEAGQRAKIFRDFDAGVMARTIRAAIDAVPSRLAVEPDLDLDSYAAELATTFDLATRR